MDSVYYRYTVFPDVHIIMYLYLYFEDRFRQSGTKTRCANFRLRLGIYGALPCDVIIIVQGVMKSHINYQNIQDIVLL